MKETRYMAQDRVTTTAEIKELVSQLRIQALDTAVMGARPSAELLRAAARALEARLELPETEWQYGWQSFLPEETDQYEWQKCFSRKEAQDEVDELNREEEGQKFPIRYVLSRRRPYTKPGPWEIVKD